MLVGSPCRHPIGSGSVAQAPIGIVGRYRSSPGWACVGLGISSSWLSALVRVFPHEPHTMITNVTVVILPQPGSAR